MEPLRIEFQQYSASCERLLGLAALGTTLTEEEQDILLYYARELAKAFDETVIVPR
jgi:hypothetical protein